MYARINTSNNASFSGHLTRDIIEHKVSRGRAFTVFFTVPDGMGTDSNGNPYVQHLFANAYVPEGSKPGALAWAKKGAPVNIAARLTNNSYINENGERTSAGLRLEIVPGGFEVTETRRQREDREARRARYNQNQTQAPAVEEVETAEVTNVSSDYTKVESDPLADIPVANAPAAAPAAQPQAEPQAPAGWNGFGQLDSTDPWAAYVG